MAYNHTSEHRPERIEYKKQFQAKTYVQLKFFTVKQPFDLIHEGVKLTISPTDRLFPSGARSPYFNCPVRDLHALLIPRILLKRNNSAVRKDKF